MKQVLFRLILSFILSLQCLLIAQAQVAVVKSTEIRTLEGKEYYIHQIEQGQTAYSISRAYELSIDELYFENPEAKSGLREGSTLKIPLLSRDKKISNELRSDDFNFIFHIVQKGETLYSIGRVYDVPVDAIRQFNPGADQGLKTGQYLKIPVRNAHSAVEEGDVPSLDKPAPQLIKHKVVAGETIYKITRQYSLTFEELREWNPGLTTEISAGDIIYIPLMSLADRPDQHSYVEHTVQAKETLYGIALYYGVSIDSIRLINPGLSSSLQIGQVILVPGRKSQHDYITHEVEKKSKLSKIASMYSLDIDEIREINPSAGNKVKEGTVLRIPVPPMTGTPIPGGEMKTLPAEIVSMVDADSIRCSHDHGHHADNFSVALMLPFYLEEIDSLPELSTSSIQTYENLESFKFIQFYEGFLIAMDSLKKQGLNLKLHVYDIDEDIGKTIKVLQDTALMNADLIIGPLFRKNFKLVSNYAKLFGIKIINPLTSRDEVLDYDKVFKVKPAEKNQPGLVDHLVKENFPDAKILIVRQNQFKHEETAREIKHMLEMGLKEKIQVANSLLGNIITEYSSLDTTLVDGELLETLIIEDVKIYREFLELQLDDSTTFQNRVDEVVYSEENIQGILKKASIFRPTIVIALSDNKVFALELMTQLNEYRDSLNITLIGIPEWNTFTDMEIEYLQNLNTHVLSDSYIAFKLARTNAFISRFRQLYFTEPLQYAYDGFDVGYYFLGALMRYGRDFENCLHYYDPELIQNDYTFRYMRNRGYENQHWNILKYKDFSIRKLN